MSEQDAQSEKWGFRVVGDERTAWRWDDTTQAWVQVPLDKAPPWPITEQGGLAAEQQEDER